MTIYLFYCLICSFIPPIYATRKIRRNKRMKKGSITNYESDDYWSIS
nr:MAG TPA: hypothetical protein [Inoviridae sp.]